MKSEAKFNIKEKIPFDTPEFPSPYTNHSPKWNENAKHISYDKLKTKLIPAKEYKRSPKHLLVVTLKYFWKYQKPKLLSVDVVA